MYRSFVLIENFSLPLTTLAMALVTAHNRTVLANLEEGDVVEFVRGVYSHYGVYIGNEDIVHLAGDEDDGLSNVQLQHSGTICGQSFSKAYVKKENFWRVADQSKAYKKNKDNSTKFRPLSKQEIVRNALSKLGYVGYNVLFKNCEHFANWCRYGIEQSDQADGFFTGLALAAAGVGAVIGAALLMGGKEEKQKQ